MLVRIVRKLTLDEVQNRIKSFEKEYGVTLDEFEGLYLQKKVDRIHFEAYYEWADLVDAYRGYVESGELDCIVEETRDLEPQKAVLLTPKRVELLQCLGSLYIDSISDLARKTGRNVKNVYQDLKSLESLNLVSFNRRGGRNVVPETLVEEITLLIR